VGSCGGGGGGEWEGGGEREGRAIVAGSTPCVVLRVRVSGGGEGGGREGGGGDGQGAVVAEIERVLGKSVHRALEELGDGEEGREGGAVWGMIRNSSASRSINIGGGNTVASAVFAAAAAAATTTITTAEGRVTTAAAERGGREGERNSGVVAALVAAAAMGERTVEVPEMREGRGEGGRAGVVERLALVHEDDLGAVFLARYPTAAAATAAAATAPPASSSKPAFTRSNSSGSKGPSSFFLKTSLTPAVKKDEVNPSPSSVPSYTYCLLRASNKASLVASHAEAAALKVRHIPCFPPFPPPSLLETTI